MTTRRIHTWVLAWLGAFIAHQLGYGIAAAAGIAESGPDHAYLSGFGALVVPLLIVVLSVAALIAARSHLELGATSVAVLTGAQASAFIVVETVEYLGASDLSGLWSSPAVWIGLLVQPAVAWLFIRIVTAGARAVERGWPAGAVPRVAAADDAPLLIGPDRARPYRNVYLPLAARAPPLAP